MTPAAGRGGNPPFTKHPISAGSAGGRHPGGRAPAGAVTPPRLPPLRPGGAPGPGTAAPPPSHAWGGGSALPGAGEPRRLSEAEPEAAAHPRMRAGRRRGEQRRVAPAQRRHRLPRGDPWRFGRGRHRAAPAAGPGRFQPCPPARGQVSRRAGSSGLSAGDFSVPESHREGMVWGFTSLNMITCSCMSGWAT